MAVQGRRIQKWMKKLVTDFLAWCAVAKVN